MSGDPRAADAKNDGSNAWSEGKYDLAVEHFSTAIIFGGDKDFLKVLHSNRSAAYLKLNKVEEALKDGNKCVELDPNWAKGYTRKGDALLASKKFTDAYNAYNNALRLSPGDSSLTSKCEQAMRAMRNTSSSSSTSSTRGGGGAVNIEPATGYMFYVKAAIMGLCIAYLLPLGRNINMYAYKGAAGLSVSASILSIYKKHGFPQFNTAYAEKALTDPGFMKIFLGAFLLMTKPYILAIAPVFFTEMTAFTPQILTYVKDNVAQVQGKIQPLIARFMPSMGNIDISRMIGSLSASQFNFHLMKMSALVEVYQGIFLIIELLLPTRNFMILYLWWQYLQMRYMMDQSGNIKAAFITVDQKIFSLLSHRMCPELVRKGYGFVKNFMAKQVEKGERQMNGSTPAAAGGGGGLMGGLSSAMSKCNIM